MKRLIAISFFLAICSAAFGQINPTTHIKPAQDTGRVLISKSNNRYVERNLYTYLKDSLNFGLAVVDSTRLLTDSILVYYNAGSEVGRDTIRIASTGGATAAAGDSTQIQFNGGNGNTFAADADFYYATVVDIMYAPNVYINDILGHNGDNDTYFYYTDDRCQIFAGLENLMDIFEGVQDYVKLGDGGDVDVNLNDDLFVQGSNGYIGIGTTGPLNQLDLVVNTANTFRMYAATSGAQTIRLQESTNYGDITFDNTDVTYNTSSSLGSHLFKHGGTTAMYTLSSEVGLGTSVDLNFSASSEINDSNGSTGTDGYYLRNKVGGGVEWAAVSGGTPGGSTTHVQYNNAGAFGGESTFTYNSTTNQLTIEDLYVTDNLLDGIGSAGTNLELLTTTGTESRWRTVSMTASLGLLTFDLDGVTAATVDLSNATLSDAGSIENNNSSQDLHQTSLTKVTEWGTTPEFSGTGITWTSATDRWTVAYSGKYEITFSVCMENQSTGDVCVQFWVYKNGSAAGVPYYATVQDAYNQSITHTVTLDLNASDYLEIYSGRCDTNTATVAFCSAVNGGIFDVKRINY